MNAPESSVTTAPVHWRQRLQAWLGLLPSDPIKPAKRAEIAALYDPPPSIANLLRWEEYDPATRCFTLQDGVSVGALFEIRPLDAEARPLAKLEELQQRLTNALNTLPERETNPWIIQLYLQDEPLTAMDMTLREYLARFPDADSPFREHYQAVQSEHFSQLATRGGLFEDSKAGIRWAGRYRRVRMTLYREFTGERWPNRLGHLPADELNDVSARLIAGLESVGISVRRSGGKELYEWLLPWLSPSPLGQDPWDYLRQFPYPEQTEADGGLPAGFDLATLIFSARPRSGDSKDGLWYFNGLPHRVLCIDHLTDRPVPGVMTLENDDGEQKQTASVFDRLPENSIFCMTLILQDQDSLRDGVERIRRLSQGQIAEVQLAHQDAEAVVMAMASGHKLVPVIMNLFLRGEDETDLQRKTLHAAYTLRAANLQVVEPDVDVMGLTEYARFLPFAYEHSLDKTLYRAQRVFAWHAMALSPLWGQSVGTGQPGMVFYNRSGYPIMLDPLNPRGRQRNAHALILGPTGSGKSATLNYLSMSVMATHRPHLYILDVGDSFRLLGDEFKAQGLSVHYVRFTPEADIAFPPFAHAMRLLEDVDSLASRLTPEVDEGQEDDAIELEESAEDLSEERDLLGEMEIAARLMITGGEPDEERQLRRHDRMVIRHALLLAAEAVREEGERDQVMVSDVVEGFRRIARGEPLYGLDEALDESRRARASEMGDAMNLFVAGARDRFFNRPGQVFPEVDVTIVDLGLLGRDGYEDALAIAVIGFMNEIQTAAERRRYSGRQSLALIDEAHITTTNPLLARYLAKGAKMWRKWGLWLWLATQNLQDFPDEAAKILNMCEWWLCLSMPPAEIEQIARYKTLTDEHKAMLEKARKEPGKYVEGVILSDMDPKLFRNVPPALALALAQTEKDERAERAAIMQETGCTELDAVYQVAERIARQRAGL